MNCCKTIDRAIAIALVATVGITTVSNAQKTSQNKDKETSSTAKIFGGRAQYRTWSVGLHAGVLAPVILTGASKNNEYTNWDVNLGYGLAIRKQLAHSFGLELSAFRGKLSGSNKDAPGGHNNSRKSFDMPIDWSATLMGVVNVATVDFLRRENSINFLVKSGFGLTRYKGSYEKVNSADGSPQVPGTGTDAGSTEKQFPIGVGVKFKISDRINFDLGYNMYFVDVAHLDRGNVTAYSVRLSQKDKYSYTYGGLELSLGPKVRPNLDWVNPIAIMYDELKDPSLRKELDELKKRVTEQGLRIDSLSKDSDGDGVSDKFDKCPNTEIGIKIDGSGCPLDSDADGIPDLRDKCPTEAGPGPDGCPENANKNIAQPVAAPLQHNDKNIQFDFDSAVLKTSCYSILDQLSADVKANLYSKIRLEGHASTEGSDEHNIQLSVDRANSVKTYLVNAGVASSKISIKGFGKGHPIAPNDTDDGRSKNRRVEIKKSK